MPFPRQKLTDLQQLTAYYISSNLEGVDALLRFSNVGVIGRALSNMVNLQYGYLDYIALNAVPFTAVDESLIGWAALKGIFQKAATSASGVVTFPCTGTVSVPSGTLLTRSDGVGAVSTATVANVGSSVLVPATISPDPTGLTGAFGNCDVGVTFTLGGAIAGVNSSGFVSTGFTGGSDLESQDDLRTRMLAAYQDVSGTGSPSDFIKWALAVAGVTRAWCVRNFMGPGTVGVFTMFDQAEAAHGGFPQGTNGTATGETRDANATGDQLAVANFLFTAVPGEPLSGLQPATALVYSNAPNNNAIPFTLQGIAGASTATKAAILAALQDLFIREATADGTGQIDLSDMNAAIGSVPLTQGFIITAPTTNVANVVSFLATVGVISYT